MRKDTTGVAAQGTAALPTHPRMNKTFVVPKVRSVGCVSLALYRSSE
jgi:hypothetical protein